MDFAEHFPVWDKLTQAQQNKISQSAVLRTVQPGTVVYRNSAECLGLLLINYGQLRAFILSEEGREITVYRLSERDVCLFSASCVMQNIQFDIVIEAEKETQFLVIPPDVYKELFEQSTAVSNYINDIMGSRFSEVVWLMEQVMWKRFDKRLADFLLQESALDKSSSLKITHEKIANHMGSAREVVTRMLRYFQDEGMVRLSRGEIEIIDAKKLRLFADS